MKLEFRCRDVFGDVYYKTVDLPDDAEQCVGKTADGEKIFVGDDVKVEGVNRKFRVYLKGMAFSEDGCYLSESQLKNSRKICDERLNNS